MNTIERYESLQARLRELGGDVRVVMYSRAPLYVGQMVVLATLPETHGLEAELDLVEAYVEGRERNELK